MFAGGSGRVLQEMWLLSEVHTQQVHLMKHQLKVSGGRWLQTERAKGAKGIPRTWRIVEAYESAWTDDHLISATDAMCHEDGMGVFQPCSLTWQTKMFRMYSKSLTTSEELLVNRILNHPYKGFYGFLRKDAGIKEEVRNKWCRLCPYWEHTSAAYQEEGAEFDGPAMNAEVRVVADEADTDSVKVERLHSRSQRRNMFRV